MASRPARIRLELTTLDEVEPGFADATLDWLTDEESACLAGMGSMQRRRQFLAGHWLARRLASALGGGAVRDWRLLAGDGIRRLAARDGSQLFVSISHCADRVACAVSTVAVGLDIELERKPRDYLALARAIMAADEHQSFVGEQPERRAQLFLQRWTLAEARGKLVGEGLRPEQARKFRPRPCAPGDAQARVWPIETGSLALCHAADVETAIEGVAALSPPTHWRFAMATG